MKTKKTTINLSEKEFELLEVAIVKFCVETGARRNASATIRFALRQYVSTTTKAVVSKLIGRGKLGVERVEGADYLWLKV